jgi:hypothetical protein
VPEEVRDIHKNTPKVISQFRMSTFRVVFQKYLKSQNLNQATNSRAKPKLSQTNNICDRHTLHIVVIIT